MVYRLLVIQAILAIALISCKHQPKTVNHPSDAETYRRQLELYPFLSKFKPLPRKPLKLNFINKDRSLVKIDEPKDLDFIGYGAAYGLLSDTSKFYALLWYSNNADEGSLELTTLDKTGKKADEKMLYATMPGDDCGYEWYGWAFLNPDMTILVRDSIVTYDCDNGIPPESQRQHEVDSMEVKIEPTGKIEFSEIRKSIIK